MALPRRCIERGRLRGSMGYRVRARIVREWAGTLISFWLPVLGRA